MYKQVLMRTLSCSNITLHIIIRIRIPLSLCHRLRRFVVAVRIARAKAILVFQVPPLIFPLHLEMDLLLFLLQSRMVVAHLSTSRILLMAAQHLRPLLRHNMKAPLLLVDSPTELHIVFKLREQMVLERDCRRHRSPLHLPPNNIIRTPDKKL